MPEHDNTRDTYDVSDRATYELLAFHTNHPEGYGIDVEPSQPVDSATLDYTYGRHSGHGGYLYRDRASRFIDPAKLKGVGEHREGSTCGCSLDY
jgi:hypothetical protein